MMRLLFILTGCVLAHLAEAQSPQRRSFMVGPTVGMNQLSYLGTAPSTTSPANFMVGLDASYRINRLLFGVRPVYAKRIYRQTAVIFELGPNYLISTPGTSLRVNTDFETLTIPLTVSYKVNHETQYEWYVGAAVAMDYLLNIGRQRFISPAGAVTIDRQPAPNELGKSVNIGLGAQTTLRYLLSTHLGLQIEPAVRYYPTKGFPTTVAGNIQVQGMVSLLVKL